MTCIALTNASQVERTESITHAMALSEIPEHEMQSTFEISKPRLFDMRLMTDSTENNSNTSSRSEASSLEGALQSLSTVLEDYQGQYPELQHLEEQVQALERLLKVRKSALDHLDHLRPRKKYCLFPVMVRKK